jgi:hypothetical protein
MANTVPVSLSLEEKQIIINTLNEYALAEKLQAAGPNAELSGSEIKTILTSLRDYGNVAGDQEELILRKLQAGLNFLG